MKRVKWIAAWLSLSVPVEVPFFIVQRAHTPGFEPPGNAVEVEGMVADSPRCRALFLRICNLVSLAINAWLHDMILADRAVVNVDVYTNPMLSFTILPTRSAKSQLVTYPRPRERLHSISLLQTLLVSTIQPFLNQNLLY